MEAPTLPVVLLRLVEILPRVMARDRPTEGTTRRTMTLLRMHTILTRIRGTARHLATPFFGEAHQVLHRPGVLMGPMDLRRLAMVITLSTGLLTTAPVTFLPLRLIITPIPLITDMDLPHLQLHAPPMQI